MREKRGFYNAVYLIIIIAAIAGIALVAKKGFSKDIAETTAYTSDLVDSHGATGAEPGYAYTTETTYNGYPVLGAKVFSQPFQKTDDYTSNLDLYNNGILTEEDMNVISSVASNAMTALFGSTDKSASERADIIAGVLSSNFALEEGDNYYLGASEVSEKLNEIYTDENIRMEIEFITDKSLVYYDESCYVVRGLMYVTVYSCDVKSTIKNMFGVDSFELGEEFSVVVEAYMSPDANYYKDYDGYKMTAFTVLDV